MIEILMDAWDLVSDFFIQGSEEFADKIQDLGDNVQELGQEIEKAAKNQKSDKKGTKWLGLYLYDNDIWKLLFRFAINFGVLFVIIRAIYYPIAKRKDYLFSYFLISLIIFSICFALKKFDLEMGAALGLFAIFGIIRYRTDPIPIKEMTYLFIVIGVSVINSMANDAMSYVELAFINLSVLLVTFVIERLWLLKHESRKVITYEKIELIKADRSDDLKADIEERTGLKISRIQIGKIDFLRDTAQVYVYFYESEQTGHFKDEGISSSR